MVWSVRRTALSGVIGVISLGISLADIATAEAQTVQSKITPNGCTTEGVQGISKQLAETQMCMNPGFFVPFTPHAKVSLQSSRVHPYLQATARTALWNAANNTSLTVTSAFRTVADQYILYYSGGCAAAAKPGSSNHQSGRAVDISNYSAAKASLEAAGCKWFGSGDPVHFDCPGVDGRADSVRAVQRLWNLNNPTDQIAEDGIYGPQTEARLAQSPAAGFPIGGCEEPNVPVECANGTAPFYWDCDGPIGGMTCLPITEPSDTSAWSNNYLCAETDLGVRWSSAGPIAGMRCAEITAVSDPDWSDNYLCVPQSSPYYFTWSEVGPIAGQDCVGWFEPEDPDGWDDRYLCWVYDDTQAGGAGGSSGQAAGGAPSASGGAGAANHAGGARPDEGVAGLGPGNEHTAGGAGGTVQEPGVDLSRRESGEAAACAANLSSGAPGGAWYWLGALGFGLLRRRKRRPEQR